jgi:hypothetical protein
MDGVVERERFKVRGVDGACLINGRGSVRGWDFDKLLKVEEDLG